LEQKERDWLDKIKKAEDRARKDAEARERAKATEEKRELSDKYEAEIRDLTNRLKVNPSDYPYVLDGKLTVIS